MVTVGEGLGVDEGIRVMVATGATVKVGISVGITAVDGETGTHPVTIKAMIRVNTLDNLVIQYSCVMS